MKDVYLYEKTRKSPHLEYIEEFGFLRENPDTKKPYFTMGYDFKMYNEQKKRHFMNSVQFSHFAEMIRQSEYEEDYEIKAEADGIWFWFRRSLPVVTVLEKHFKKNDGTSSIG